MSSLWLLPAATVVVSLIPLTAMARRALREVAGLRRELHLAARLRPAVIELRDETALLQARLDQLRRR
ncbi:MAG: hypothetical protein ACRD0D_11600 [Acidimicrobiales bacterium]